MKTTLNMSQHCVDRASTVLPPISPFRTAVVLGLFLVTFLLMQGATGTKATKILHPLAGFPKQLGNWTLEANRSSSSEVIDLLGVDDYIDYTYRDKDGRRVNLYVGFYESVGGGKGYHSPKNCLPGGGWGIDRTGTVQLSLPGNAHKTVTIAEMVIREGSEYQVVLYWFQNRGRIIASEYWEKVYLVLDALMKKRRDGSFVRLMARAPDGDIEQTEIMLKKFAALALVELDNYLPGESR